MASVSLTGNDTAVISGIPMVDVADGDWLTLTYPNTLAEVKTGKNGNSIYALNATGLQAEVTIRLLRGSVNDTQLDSLLQLQNQDFSSFILLEGQFVKRVGDGQGNITSDTYNVAGGIFHYNVDAKSNAEADTEQSISVYRLKFANAARAVF